MEHKEYNSIRVFQNPFLERLTHVHPITPLIVWIPYISWLIWRSLTFHHLSPFVVGAFGVFGFLFWTFAEYVLHRFIFHFVPEGEWQKRFQYLIHGLHHSDPQDPTRLVMPPTASITIALALYVIFRTFLGGVLVEPFFAFFLVGYLCYDYTHYAVHHFKPRTRMGKFVKQHHMMHHFVNHDSRWGVSTPIWDYVFGTLDLPAKNKESAV